MTKCSVLIEGEPRICEIVKENPRSVWVRIARAKRQKVRRRKRWGMGEFGRFFESIPTVISVDQHSIIKRHKAKHGFVRE